jgi:hypothetical protein
VQQKYGVDIGYERFLAPEIFYNPEIYSSDFLTPLPEIVDDVIQQSPIDVRRGLYKVCRDDSGAFLRVFDIFTEHCALRRLNYVPTLWAEVEA